MILLKLYLPNLLFQEPYRERTTTVPVRPVPNRPTICTTRTVAGVVRQVVLVERRVAAVVARPPVVVVVAAVVEAEPSTCPPRV